MRRAGWTARPADVERATQEGLAATLDRLFPVEPPRLTKPRLVRVNGCLHGVGPSLQLERNQDFLFGNDFRRVYATALENWLGCPPNQVLDGRFDRVAFV